MLDQIRMAKAYWSITRSKNKLGLYGYLMKYIKIGNTLLEKQGLTLSYIPVARKLRAMRQSKEESLNALKKQSAFLNQLAAKTVPKPLHCIPLQRTTDYFLQDHGSKEVLNKDKLEDPSLYHYSIVSGKLATSVVVNSTVLLHAKEPEIETCFSYSHRQTACCSNGDVVPCQPNPTPTPRGSVPVMMRKLVSSLMEEVGGHLRFSDVPLVLFGLFICSALLQRLTNKGPMIWPVIGIVPSLFFHINHMYDWITEALIECGGTFRFRGVWMSGTFGIVTVDPSNIEYMLKTRFKNFPKGKSYRERFSDLLGDGIFNADYELWKEQRRAATSEMHSSRFVEYSFQTMQELVHKKLLKLIDKHVKWKESVDLQDVLLRFTFDNICTAAFGVDPGCLALELPHVPFAKAFEEATEFTSFRFIVPPYVWKPMKFFGVGIEKRLKKAVQIVHKFAEKTVIDRRIESNKLGSLNHRYDLLSRLIEEEEDPDEQRKKNRFSNKFLKDFCISFILAGRDTSSVALAWFFWLIHEHPQVENRILSEINEIIGHRKSNKEPVLDDVVFTIDELKKMVYLQAALSESLRLYPSVPVDFKEAQEDDVFPDGTVVAKGARIFYSIFSMARVEAIWGNDCKEFKPERWIKDGQFVSENQFKYLVFNGGPRLCVGKKFAYMQMKMVAASILLRYSVKIVEGQTVVPKVTTTLYMKNGLLVTFMPR
ncbi:hypothetical protein HHK36_029528 [Tetracentron sinense]|uniref:Cytochrome P450 n=1 Tax=Tetracentron sinense TaxID=13715 RepID=A0A835D1V3_TETSI|nr:hypothetical protein HHK36_029528 [Tetracentron sinense]